MLTIVKRKASESLFFWWVLITIAYHILLFSGLPLIPGLVGFFVPIGFLSLLGMMAGGVWLPVIAIAFVITIIGIADYAGYKYSLTIGQRVLFYLAVLFVLTFSIDFFFYGCWQSFAIFIGGNACGNLAGLQ